MKKNRIILLIILVIVTVIWSKYLDTYFQNYFNLYSSGAYLFSVPISFLIISLFSKSKLNLLSIPFIFVGVLIVILLSRDYKNSFLLEKIIGTIIGAILTCLTTILFIRKEKKADLLDNNAR